MRVAVRPVCRPLEAGATVSKDAEVAFLATRLSALGHDPCGGSEVVFWEDREILRSAGIPVRVYGRAVRNGAPVEEIPIHTCLPLISSLEYCGQFLRKEPKAVLVAYNEPMLAGLAPRRTIVRFDFSTPLPRYWKSPVWLTRFKQAIYLFPSESERHLFLEKHPLIPKDSTVVIPNAVDLRLFQPARESTPSLRVGFAGQWAPEKGVTTLLSAWSLVRNQLPAAELWIAGSERLWKGVHVSPASREVADRVGVMARDGLVRIAGECKRSEMPAFWNSVEIAVVPSVREAFGLVALEALACGVPVIASRVGGLPEVVVDGECGLLVPPHDPRQLAEALVGLLTKEPLRCRLAERARRRAEEFSIERRAESFLGLLAKRVESAGGARPKCTSTRGRRTETLMGTRSEAEGTRFRDRIFHAMARSGIVRSAYGACRQVPVLATLLHAGVDRFMPHGKRLWTRLRAGLGKGLWLYTDPRFDFPHANGDHEPWVQNLLQSYLGPGDCFYDVGAHIGFFSLIAARQVGEHGLVVAFEADPQNASLLQVHASRNHMPQMILVKAAAWSSSCQLTFEQASRASNRTEGHVSMNDTEGKQGIIVSAISLDDFIFLQNGRAPRLVKIDVEGAEWEVLQGARRMLRELQPHLVCEIHDLEMIGKTEHFLDEFGYATEHWQPVQPRYPEYRQHYVWATAK